MSEVEKFIPLLKLNYANQVRRQNQLILGEELSKDRPPCQIMSKAMVHFNVSHQVSLFCPGRVKHQVLTGESTPG